MLLKKIDFFILIYVYNNMNKSLISVVLFNYNNSNLKYYILVLEKLINHIKYKNFDLVIYYDHSLNINDYKILINKNVFLIKKVFNDDLHHGMFPLFLRLLPIFDNINFNNLNYKFYYVCDLTKGIFDFLKLKNSDDNLFGQTTHIFNLSPFLYNYENNLNKYDLKYFCSFLRFNKKLPCHLLYNFLNLLEEIYIYGYSENILGNYILEIYHNMIYTNETIYLSKKMLEKKTLINRLTFSLFINFVVYDYIRNNNLSYNFRILDYDICYYRDIFYIWYEKNIKNEKLINDFINEVNEKFNLKSKSFNELMNNFSLLNMNYLNLNKIFLEEFIFKIDLIKYKFDKLICH